jgi:hypothetical protein
MSDVPEFARFHMLSVTFDGTPWYKKGGTITARLAFEGETVVTVMRDGHTNTSTASDGDYIVPNPRGGEKLVPKREFLAKYQLVQGNQYAFRPVRVIVLEENVEYILFWLAPQTHRVRRGGAIINDGTGSPYGIQPEEFRLYALCDEAGNLI